MKLIKNLLTISLQNLNRLTSCGKTHLVNSIAGQLGIPYFRVSSPELVSGMSGESEARIRELFQAASDSAPAIIFLDEIDAIAPKRNDGKGNDRDHAADNRDNQRRLKN